MDNDVYYRPIMTSTGPTVACMQWFDECDYDHSKYITDEKFDTEEEAIKFIHGLQWI